MKSARTIAIVAFAIAMAALATHGRPRARGGHAPRRTHRHDC